MKTLWVLVSVLLCTGTFATEVTKSKTCNGASCSPSLTTPFIVNDIKSSSDSSKLVKPIVLDASQSRVGLHLHTSDVVPPTTPGALPASQYYEPLNDANGNPINLNDPPKLPLLHGQDLGGDTTEVEDQELLDAVHGTAQLTSSTPADLKTFQDQIKAEAIAELAAEEGGATASAASPSSSSTDSEAGAAAASTEAGAAAGGAGGSDAALEAALAADEKASAASTHTPTETEIDEQLKKLVGAGDPRLHSLEAVEQTAKAQAAVMKRAASILKLLDKAYGELGAKLAAVTTQRNALRHQYLNTREYLHALHLHALKLLKQDTEVSYTPADLATTPAAQFLNALPASAATMNSAGAILAKIQDLLLAASGQTPAAPKVEDSTCCGNDPISRELQALINGGTTGVAPPAADDSTGDDDMPPLSSTGYWSILSSSTGEEEPPPAVSSSTGDEEPPADSSTAEEPTPVESSSTEPPPTVESSTATNTNTDFIDDAEFARVEALAEASVKAHEKRHETTAAKHAAGKAGKKHHKAPHTKDDDMVISDMSVKETAKTTTKASVTDMDDPKDWVKHFGELNIKDAQTVSSIPAIPDPDKLTLADLPALKASLMGQTPKESDAPALEPLPQLPAVSLLEMGSSTHAKTQDPSIAELMASVKAKMAQTNSIVAQLKALKEQNDNMATDPHQQAKMARELAALQRGESVFTTSARVAPTSSVKPMDMLSTLRKLKEPDAATVHASDANFPSFDELGLLETSERAQVKHSQKQHHTLPTQPDDGSLAMPVFPSDPEIKVDAREAMDVVAAAMAVDPRGSSHKKAASSSHKKKHHPAAQGSAFLQVDSTVTNQEGSERNFKAEIAHQERVLDHLHNKYSHNQYTDSLRQVLGDPVMSAGENFPGKHTSYVSGHPRVVAAESVKADLDRNAQNMYQDVMAASEGGDGDDVLFSHDSNPMRFRQHANHGGSSSLKESGVGVIADVPSSNADDKYVFPDLDIPNLHLKTVQTPSAQLASIMNNGPAPVDNVNELIETYKHSLASIRGEDEQHNWDDLEQLRAHTTVTPSVQKLLDQAQAVLAGKPLPKSHFNNVGLAGALSFIDKGLSHPVHEPQLSADEAYRRVLHATHSKASSSPTTKKSSHSHHTTTSSDDATSFLQESSQQEHTKKHHDLHHAKDMSVEELKKLASKHIKEGDKVVRKISDFQQELVQKDPKFKSIGSHELLHKPVVHHHHHPQATSAMLETSSTIVTHDKESESLPDILIEQAAQRAAEKAEDDIEALLMKANGAITTDKKIVTDMVGVHAKMRSLKKEYDALAKSDASDVATLKAEEAMITKATSTHHPAKSASAITNEQLSLLEDAAMTMEHHKKGARRMRAKMGVQSEKHRRRKHGHS